MIFDNDSLNQAAQRIDEDFVKSLALAIMLTPFGYFGLLLIEEWLVATLCREL